MSSHSQNYNGFSLIELVVVITILSILIWIVTSFFVSLQKTWDKQEIASEILSVQSIISWLNPPRFVYKDYYDIEVFNDLNTIPNNSFVDVYHSIEVIIPRLFDYTSPNPRSILSDDIINYSAENIYLWLEKCIIYFNPDGNLIDSQSFLSECDDLITWSPKLKIQWFIISNNDSLVLESEWKYFNNNWQLWELINIFNSNTQFVERWSVIDIPFDSIYFNLLTDGFDDFYNNPFLIFNLQKLDWTGDYWIFNWSITEFWNSVFDNYIPWVLNSSIIDNSDISQDLDNRVNFTLIDFKNLNFFYTNPTDFATSWFILSKFWF